MVSPYGDESEIFQSVRASGHLNYALRITHYELKSFFYLHKAAHHAVEGELLL